MTGRLGDGVRQLLLQASAALAARDEGGVDAAFQLLGRHAQEFAEVAVAVEEALLQSYLFLGYPLALEALRRWRAVSGRPAPAPSADDWDGWTRRGADVGRTVYGGQYEELRASVRALHPDMERWMVAEGYGKVLGRPGLDLVDRELCIVALLAALDTPRQLYSHLRGALHAGATEREVARALEQAAACSSPAARQQAAETWARVRARTAPSGAAADEARP